MGDNRLALPDVTLCAVASTNVDATALALHACLDWINFGACKFLTDSDLDPGHPEILLVQIEKIGSIEDYSKFILVDLAVHIETSHCLIVQWDGFVLDATQWTPEFLACDYVGARWPQFDDGHDVGNGGFSLRSRRMMDACRHPEFRHGDPEDLAICRTNRAWLERRGLVFASPDLADRFSTERVGHITASFGFHGIFNMPEAIGIDAFWDRYRILDDRGTAWADLNALLRALRQANNFCSRALRMILDRISDAVRIS